MNLGRMATAVVTLSLFGCGQDSREPLFPAPERTPVSVSTPVPNAEPTAMPTIWPTIQPTIQPTPAPSVLPVITPSPQPTLTPGSGSTPAPSPTAGPGPTPTASATPEPHATPALSAEQVIAELVAAGVIPPEPPANESLLGRDIEGNGIRDDIDEWISTLTLTDRALNVVNDKARGMQAILYMSLASSSEIERHGRADLKALACLGNLAPGMELVISSQLAERTFNTRERVRRLKQHSRAASGSVISYPTGDPCE